MQRLPPPWSAEASSRQRYVPVGALVVIVVALVYSALPFTFAGVVECSAALGGSRAAEDTPAGATVGNADQACADTGGRRLVNAAVVGGAALVIGLAGAFLPADGAPPGRSGDLLAGEPPDGEGEGEGGGHQG
ncbi:MAG TPA: hypothetical protein VNT56_11295 [Acidimicrobiales bacterium]|jgi:hypothetical protein|nr:hypothetical protein [Acidimicrobiales bacterium]